MIAEKKEPVMTPQQQRGAFNLSLAAAEEINGDDGHHRAQESANRREQRGDIGRQRKVWLADHREQSSDSRAVRNSKNVGIRKRVAQQRLKAASGYGERRAYENRQEDSRQPQTEDDQAVLAGDFVAAADEHAEQVVPEPVQRHRHRAELQGDEYDQEQNQQQDRALPEQAADRQRAHAHASSSCFWACEPGSAAFGAGVNASG